MSRFTVILLFVIMVIYQSEATDDDNGEHDHVIIHVPYHIKTIKHTHTITKHIHRKNNGDSDDHDDDRYEVLGYTYGHPIDLGGQLGGHIDTWSNDFGGQNLASEISVGHEGY